MKQTMEENKNFDNWYKKRITENLTEPPTDAWENISDELDTLEVWDRLSQQLDTPGGWPAAKSLYYAVPVALLLFLSGGIIYYYYNTVDPAPFTPAAVEEEITAAHPGIKESPLRDNTGEKSAKDQRTEGATRQHTVQGDNGKATASADVNARSGQRTMETARKETSATAETRVKETDATAETFSADNDHRDQELIAAADKTATRDPGETDRYVQDDGHAEKTPDEKNADTEARSQSRIEHAGTDEEKDSKEAIDKTNTAVTKTVPVTISDDIAVAGKGGSVVSLVVPDSMLTIYPVDASILPVSPVDVEVHRQEKPLYKKSIEFGVTASAKNTWLLNRTTLMGLEKHTLNTTLPDFGKDVGMVVTYHFSRRWSAQAEGLFLSELGQRYQEYRNGKYVDREVDLRYYTMNLVMKYHRNTIVGAAPVNGHALIGGIFAGRLQRASEVINDNATDNGYNYTQVNYGLLAGYEYNRYVFKNLVFTTGLRINYGLPNIDALGYSRTATGSFDVNVALKYRLGL